MEIIEILTREEHKTSKPNDSLHRKGEMPTVSKEQERFAMVISEVPLETLSQSLSDFSAEMDKVFAKADQESKCFSLEEIELSVEISASGGVRLIGSFEAGASGSVKLKFKRKQHA